MDKIFDHILDNLVLADIWEEIIKRILDAPKEGADFWLLLFVLAAGCICWLWIGTAQDQQPVLRRRLGAGAILAVLAGAAIWVNHTFFQREPVFSKDHTGILVMRIEGDDACFYDVHRLHPQEYLSGYNALLLMAISAELFPDLAWPPHLVSRDELAGVVHYAANAAQENAEMTGDGDNQIWSAVALSGLEMLKDNNKEAIQYIEDACALPSATRFFLRLLKERLELLRRLKFKERFVIGALNTVDRALKSKERQKRWARVFVFHGYPIDEKDQANRFPASAVKAVEDRICKAVENWQIGAGDLAICSGSTEGDVIFGERCLELKSCVRLLVLEPTPLQRLKHFIDRASTEWVDRRSSLLNNPEVEIWYHTVELGDPVDPASAEGRHNRWILHTARMEAENSSEEICPTEETRLYGLILWDGSLSNLKLTDPEDPVFFISEISAANRFKDQVVTINPCRASE